MDRIQEACDRAISEATSDPKMRTQSNVYVTKHLFDCMPLITEFIRLSPEMSPRVLRGSRLPYPGSILIFNHKTSTCTRYQVTNLFQSESNKETPQPTDKENIPPTLEIIGSSQSQPVFPIK